ncbi:hypothetical protein [Saccharopolyspora spinosa]|uniref:hypothetical protein n=1 Tax=Saccharopolyspora spinosa TaxID=60894 RepID=UPI000237B2CE
MPEPVVESTLRILGEPKAAERQVSRDVERVLARLPRTFAEWAVRNAAPFERPVNAMNAMLTGGLRRSTILAPELIEVGGNGA